MSGNGTSKKVKVFAILTGFGGQYLASSGRFEHLFLNTVLNPPALI